MKLVELLAENLKSWADTTTCYVQDPCGTAWPCGIIPEFDGDSWVGGSNLIDQNGEAEMLTLDLSENYSSSIVKKAQWQAERDRQKGGEWKRHRAGRNQPVNAGVRVEVKLRCGDIQQGNAHEFIWLHSECDVAANIMQYRVISQPQAEEVEVNIPNAKTLETMEATDRGEGLTTFDSKEALYEALGMTESASTAAQWHQIDGPTKWRDTVNELDAYIEEFTREREALINRLALEGFALLPAMAPVAGVADIDMGDWRNLKVGDIIECSSDGEWLAGFRGRQAAITDVETPDYDGELPICARNYSGLTYWGQGYKFIRRP